MIATTPNIRSRLWPVALATVTGLGCTLAVLHLTPLIGGLYDDACYALLAHAIVKNGLVYLSTWSHQYPPGLPLLIAACWKAWPAFPANALWLKVIPVVGGALFVVTAYASLCERRPPGRALMVALLLACSPLTVTFASQLMAEVWFSSFALLALTLAERATRSRNVSHAYLSASLAATCGAFFLRTVGMVLVPAVVIVLLRRRQPMAGAMYFVIAGLIIGGWLSSQRRGNHGGYVSLLMQRHLEDADSGRLPSSDLIKRIVAHGWAYAIADQYTQEGIPGALCPALVSASFLRASRRFGVAWLPLVASILFMMVVAIGFCSTVSRRLESTDVYVVMYGALVLLWPWVTARFLVPLLPLLYDYFLCGCDRIGQVLHAWRQWHTDITWAQTLPAHAMLLIFLAASLFRDAHLLSEAALVRHSWSQAPPPSVAAALWARGHVAASGVLMAMNDAQMELYSDRRTVRPPLTTATSRLVEAVKLNDVDYFVMEPYGGVEVHDDLTERYLGRLVKVFPKAFKEVFSSDGGAVRILRVSRPLLMPAASVAP